MLTGLLLRDAECDAPVLLLAFPRIVRGDRPRLAIALGIEASLVHTALDECGDDRLGTRHGQDQIGLVGAIGIRMAFDMDERVRADGEIGGQLVQRRGRAVCEPGAGGREQNGVPIGETVDAEAAGIDGRQDVDLDRPVRGGRQGCDSRGYAVPDGLCRCLSGQPPTPTIETDTAFFELIQSSEPSLPAGGESGRRCWHGRRSA